MTLEAGFYLIEITKGLVTSHNGVHLTETAVAQAFKDYERLDWIKPGSNYFLAKVSQEISLENKSWKEIFNHLLQNKKVQLRPVPALSDKSC